MTLSIAWKTPNKPLLTTHPRVPMKQEQSEMTNKINTVLKAITDRIAGLLPSDTVKNPKLGATLVWSACSYPTKDLQCSTHIHSSINAITIYLKEPEESQVNEPNIGQE
nr:hypothetical protein [Tanacetum cinerariifolium]